MYIDAHNHLQDPRLAAEVESIVEAAASAGVVGMVVNGTTEQDWPHVQALAERYPDLVRPAFGLHPWFIRDRSPDWGRKLQDALAFPGSSIGEIGLDRWIKDYDIEDQRHVFLEQLALASELKRPASIHCLRAWGELVDCLEEAERLERGFLLHSFGGSLEVAQRCIPLGAYFSFPGAFAREKKIKQRSVFAQLPLDRILIETDAPDQLPPRSLQSHPLQNEAGEALNHPANLGSIYDYFADFRAIYAKDCANQFMSNAIKLFGFAS